MCFGGGPTINIPDPPPLAPPPPPPAPPKAPLPEQAPVETDVNPQVREAKSNKARGENKKGTDALRINLDPTVNTTGAGPAGGLNK